MSEGNVRTVIVRLEIDMEDGRLENCICSPNQPLQLKSRILKWTVYERLKLQLLRESSSADGGWPLSELSP